MDAQALAATIVALLALATVLALVRVNGRLAAERDEAHASAEDLVAGAERLEESSERLSRELADTAAELARARRELEDDRRTIAELDAELDRTGDRRSLEEGELVVVNTRKPDDQSIEGIVVRELDDRTVVLEAADLLVAGDGRGRAGAVERITLGPAVIPGPTVSFVQRGVTRPSPRQQAEGARES